MIKYQVDKRKRTIYIIDNCVFTEDIDVVYYLVNEKHFSDRVATAIVKNIRSAQYFEIHSALAELGYSNDEVKEIIYGRKKIRPKA